MFKQLVLSSLIGLTSIAYLAHSDPWIKQYLLDYYTREFQRSLACRMTCRLEEFSLVHASMQLSHMQVMPQSGCDWSWCADRFQIAFSWWHLLLYGSFDFSISIESPQMQSALIDNDLAINEHLYLAFKGPQVGMYTFLKEMVCSNVACTISDVLKKTKMHIAFDGRAKKIDNVMKSTIDVYKGALDLQDRALFNNMSGSLQFDSFDGQPTIDICLKGAASLEMPQLGKQMTPCYISGSWHHNRGILSIKNIDHSFAIDPIMIQCEGNQVDLSIDAKVPLGYAWHMLTHDNDDDRLSGSCTVQAKMQIQEHTHRLHGHLVAQRMHWKDIEIGSLGKISFNKKDEAIEGGVYIQRTSGACVGGDWRWEPRTGSAHASLKNSARLTFSPKHDWQILPDDMMLQIHTDGTQTTIAYDAKATHAKVHNQIHSAGTLGIDCDSLQAEGHFDANQFALHMQYHPNWQLNSCTYTHKDGQPLIQINANGDDYTGIVTVACVKDLLKRRYDYDLQGEGTLQVACKQSDETSYQATMHLEDGTIRLPRTYNFMNGLDCTIGIDCTLKKYTIDNLVCQLHNGRLSSQKMQIEVTDDLTPSFVYAPLLIERCLINMGKELFAVVSGNLLLSKRSDAGAWLNGQLLIDRSQLKENLFSDVFQRNLRSYTARSFEMEDDDLQCDIAIKTKYPVRIQTPFLETDARIDLQIKNKVRDPHVVGTIMLNTGKLHFPYKPLYITKGTLHFVPGHLDDPVIELFAKNTIKKNNISLQVTGSLQDQHVRLESSPTLSEEQVISLLLVGSQEESLNMVMPALIMQNIKSILFGYDQSAANMSRYFNALFKPFGRIHLVPSFIDQSGRGGLRGAIEIDLSDRWRLVLQKNFSLTEDTRIEIEHLLSDDISVRATRDIRRDFIGEVEMRYKFGNN